MSLERFHRAQDSRWAGYATALAEMRQGRKSSHWIWYIFPQIDGLGHSSTAREYALRDLEEACAYLLDPLLRQRYEEISGVAAEKLALGIPVANLMGSETDALKLASSLTLFRAAAANLQKKDDHFAGLVNRCDNMLQAMALQGFPSCAFTAQKVEISKA